MGYTLRVFQNLYQILIKQYFIDISLVDDQYKTMRRSNPEKQEELFLEFWKEKDPTPDTKRNELQDEYFSRVAYANNAFKGSTDGWRTHMGEIYIKFGRPDDIEEYR